RRDGVLCLGQLLDRERGGLAQALAARAPMRDDRLPHRRRPEAFQMIGRAGSGPLTVVAELEIHGDLVRHLHELFDLHRHANQPPASSTATVRRRYSSCSSVNASYLRCHSDGCETFTTCTAVTLYSGQFVAQSELSVVTTFAADSG